MLIFYDCMTAYHKKKYVCLEMSIIFLKSKKMEEISQFSAKNPARVRGCKPTLLTSAFLVKTLTERVFIFFGTVSAPAARNI